MSDEGATPEKKRKKRQPLAKDWRPAFLEELSQTANVTAAATTAKVSRQTAYKARVSSQEFAAAWDDAIEIAVDALEQEMRRRAMVGVKEPIYFKDQLIDHVYKPSDTLAIFLAKAHRPEKFRERHHVELDAKVEIDETKAASELLAKLEGLAGVIQAEGTET